MRRTDDETLREMQDAAHFQRLAKNPEALARRRAQHMYEYAMWIAEVDQRMTLMIAKGEVTEELAIALYAGRAEYMQTWARCMQPIAWN